MSSSAFRCSTLLFALVVALPIIKTDAFTIPTYRPLIAKQRIKQTTKPFLQFGKIIQPFSTHQLTAASQPIQEEEKQEESTAVRAPLKYIGPYPTLPLHFPKLATSSQRSRNVTGISLDFVLDTAANTNTINAQVAQELKLKKVGKALPGVGAGGAIEGGDTFELGDCELEGLAEVEDKFTFMVGLTASALPVASPAAAGVLGLAFLNCFKGGVEFTWGGSGGGGSAAPTAEPIIPSVTFYGDDNNKGIKNTLKNMESTNIKSSEGTGLPIVTMNINGVAIPALLDTGSPVTVINDEAAASAGVKIQKADDSKKKESKNPFARLTQNFKTAQAAARGDVLLVAGGNGERVELIKSQEPVDIALGDNDNIDFGKCNVFVGNLPGLAALENYFGKGSMKNNASTPPAAMLGMDVIRTKPRMVYTAKEVFF